MYYWFESKDLFEWEIGSKLAIQFNKNPLVIDQNNCTTKIINAYTFYDLDKYQKNPLNNFKVKSCLVGATNITKNEIAAMEQLLIE